MEQNRCEKSTLLLAAVIGVALHGTYSTLFNSLVEWSIFPILSLVLAVYCLHQRYLHQPMTDGMPKLIFSFFLLGFFGYNAYIRMGNPEMGSNFFSSVAIVVMALWIYRQIKQRQRLRVQAEEAERASQAEQY
ncbi:YijD family membrane protein [Proteus hauseri]|uniref:YijD family membrane protein n=1 Tax=Proteus hauseri TaxID=183417 RepID=UPI0032DABA22